MLSIYLISDVAIGFGREMFALDLSQSLVLFFLQFLNLTVGPKSTPFCGILVLSPYPGNASTGVMPMLT